MLHTVAVPEVCVQNLSSSCPEEQETAAKEFQILINDRQHREWVIRNPDAMQKLCQLVSTSCTHGIEVQIAAAGAISALARSGKEGQQALVAQPDLLADLWQLAQADAGSDSLSHAALAALWALMCETPRVQAFLGEADGQSVLLLLAFSQAPTTKEAQQKAWQTFQQAQSREELVSHLVEVPGILSWIVAQLQHPVLQGPVISWLLAIAEEGGAQAQQRLLGVSHCLDNLVTLISNSSGDGNAAVGGTALQLLAALSRASCSSFSGSVGAQPGVLEAVGRALHSKQQDIRNWAMQALYQLTSGQPAVLKAAAESEALLHGLISAMPLADGDHVALAAAALFGMCAHSGVLAQVEGIQGIPSLLADMQGGNPDAKQEAATKLHQLAAAVRRQLSGGLMGKPACEPKPAPVTPSLPSTAAVEHPGTILTGEDDMLGGLLHRFVAIGNHSTTV